MKSTNVEVQPSPRDAHLFLPSFLVQNGCDLRQLRHWHPKVFLCTSTMHETDATIGHEDLQHVIAFLAAERTAEAGRRGAENLEGSAWFLHFLVLCPVGTRSKEKENQEPTRLRSEGAGHRARDQRSPT